MNSTSTSTSKPMNHPEHAEIIVNVFGRTDVGRTRDHNEDAFVVADLSTNDASLQPAVRQHPVGPKGSLFMVADGMGGAAAGEIASQMAIETVLKEFRETWLSLENPSSEAFARCLRKAAQAANQQIHGYAASHQEFRGMGTTATIAGLLGGTLYLAQVGDSRGYLVRDGVAKQITKDQSLMQKLIEAGELTEEEAAQSERRNIILQALGPEANIKVDLTFQRVRRGDTLVLCSDGLSGQVSRDEIARVVSEDRDLVQACRKLIDLANQAGGPDNITVICARFEGPGLNEIEIDGDEVGHRPFPLNDGSQTPISTPEFSEAPTQPLRRSNAARATPKSMPAPSVPPVATAPAAIVDDEHNTPTLEVIDLSKVQAPPARRSRGMAIAMVLLALMILFGAWYVWRTMSKVVPEPAPTVTPAAL
ncbi:MAG TPA: Stp1/IreP family PP2C-type Ser/Thr phosphatase [Gemmatimonadaceae bacterium]|nr:Stp1/IreP family PP2C-type Ser/Thr phosphatase [Gemmatimonadaceae bacterium]